MRKRNVPPTDPKLHASKYDPTKHEAPEEGKPLRYMKPQHKEYARVGIHRRLLRMAVRNTEREEGEKGRAGNIHKRQKEKMERFDAHSKKGTDILKKHGVPNPSLAQMYAKWIKGNSPHSKENPEGYIRSDGKKD
jgi:hypothetical protein